MHSDTALVDPIRKSLNAKLERLLRRPLIARVDAPKPAVDSEDLPSLFFALDAIVPRAKVGAWTEDPTDGTCAVRIAVDYEDLWRGYEKEVLETVSGTVESSVTFLTEHQKRLLEHAPEEFLALRPQPEVAELTGFRTRWVGGADHVVELQLAQPPRDPDCVVYIAIVPNLTPLQRQLEALDALNAGASTGPLAPLRALVGLPAQVGGAVREAPVSLKNLDAHQTRCAQNALRTPHFALIQGPPGSGKTTVISSIVAEALNRGERVLLVSPTHVAVDNVVEKLLPKPKEEDLLEPRTLPVRFSARQKKLMEGAARYWVGPKRERRAATLALRLQARLCERSELARRLYAQLDEENYARPPLSARLEQVRPVICGTPIGILSYDAVRNAEPASFDLLIVDEVSKMTLPEFLAIAVKAKRWVLVGDPQQLPPYCSGEECGVTLDDLIPPVLELVCSVGAVLERMKPQLRSTLRLIVLTKADPARIASAIATHIRAVGLENSPRVGTPDAPGGVLVCAPNELERARQALRGETVQVLAERGLSVARPALYGGARLVEDRARAHAALFDTAFAVYHAQAWATRANQKLLALRLRKGLDKILPSAAVLEELCQIEDAQRLRAGLMQALAQRYAIQAISVYDWLTGLPTQDFDCSPLRELGPTLAGLDPLRAEVRPYVDTLKAQYRMHPSLSCVPRELFYFGDALLDGKPGAAGAARYRLLQVTPEREVTEANEDEAAAIVGTLTKLAQRSEAARVMVITPYRAQERLLNERIEAIRGQLGRIEAEVCTLDRCQGREAEFVFISLVRGRATPFLDAPKRWNVALTRAMQGLFVFGDIEAYRREAWEARRRVRGNEPPAMSLLARIIEAYDQQTSQEQRRSA